MELFLDDERQVFFPGTTIYGVLGARESDGPAEANHIPVIRVKGYTLIWKPNSTEEIDEYTLFFEHEVEQSLEVSDIDLPQIAELKNYSKIFKFHIVLPNNLPPSHEVPFGHTRYKLEAHYNDQTIFKYFSVNRWVGLVKRNDVNVKRELFTVQFFNCCQRIEVILTLSQSYFMPGEIVYVVALVTNHSWKDVLYSKISIIQTTKYWKNHHILPIKHARVIAEDTRGQIRSGEKQIWNKQPFYIPSVIPTTTSSNNPFNFFEVKYKIKMHIVMKNSNKKIMVKQRLFIGNWDKSSTHELNKPKKPSDDIIASACSLVKLENIDYVPKYIIYETSGA